MGLKKRFSKSSTAKCIQKFFFRCQKKLRKPRILGKNHWAEQNFVFVTGGSFSSQNMKVNFRLTGLKLICFQMCSQELGVFSQIMAELGARNSLFSVVIGFLSPIKISHSLSISLSSLLTIDELLLYILTIDELLFRDNSVVVDVQGLEELDSPGSIWRKWVCECV